MIFLKRENGANLSLKVYQSTRIKLEFFFSFGFFYFWWGAILLLFASLCSGLSGTRKGYPKNGKKIASHAQNCAATQLQFGLRCCLANLSDCQKFKKKTLKRINA